MRVRVRNVIIIGPDRGSEREGFVVGSREYLFRTRWANCFRIGEVVQA